MTKKFISKNVFLWHDKNSNWQTLTNKLVIFKRYGEVKDEKNEYFWGSLKNRIFRVGVHEKTNIEEEID